MRGRGLHHAEFSRRGGGRASPSVEGETGISAAAARGASLGESMYMLGRFFPFTNWDCQVEYARLSFVVGCVGGLSAWAVWGPSKLVPSQYVARSRRAIWPEVGRARGTEPVRLVVFSRSDGPVGVRRRGCGGFWASSPGFAVGPGRDPSRSPVRKYAVSRGIKWAGSSRRKRLHQRLFRNSYRRERPGVWLPALGIGARQQSHGGKGPNDENPK